MPHPISALDIDEDLLRRAGEVLGNYPAEARDGPISLVQRRLRLGYSLAKAIVEELKKRNEAVKPSRALPSGTIPPDLPLNK
jgi:DNA segregation ATPase FtsK/SpoIIIE-like protein